MTWLGLARLLLSIFDGLLSYMNKRQLLDAGAKGQIADDLLALNRRHQIGIAIQTEPRTPDEDLAELRRTGRL